LISREVEVKGRNFFPTCEGANREKRGAGRRPGRKLLSEFDHDAVMDNTNNALQFPPLIPRVYFGEPWTLTGVLRVPPES